jgi:hypothetical protein
MQIRAKGLERRRVWGRRSRLRREVVMEVAMVERPEAFSMIPLGRG